MLRFWNIEKNKSDDFGSQIKILGWSLMVKFNFKFQEKISEKLKKKSRKKCPKNWKLTKNHPKNDLSKKQWKIALKMSLQL